MLNLNIKQFLKIFLNTLMPQFILNSFSIILLLCLLQQFKMWYDMYPNPKSYYLEIILLVNKIKIMRKLSNWINNTTSIFLTIIMRNIILKSFIINNELLFIIILRSNLKKSLIFLTNNMLKNTLILINYNLDFLCRFYFDKFIPKNFFIIFNKHRFHILKPSAILFCIFFFLADMLMGLVFWLHSSINEKFMFLIKANTHIAIIGLFYTAIYWGLTILKESSQGFHTYEVQKGLKMGFLLFFIMLRKILIKSNLDFLCRVYYKHKFIPKIFFLIFNKNSFLMIGVGTENSGINPWILLGAALATGAVGLFGYLWFKKPKPDNLPEESNTELDSSTNSELSLKLDDEKGASNPDNVDHKLPQATKSEKHFKDYAEKHQDDILQGSKEFLLTNNLQNQNLRRNLDQYLLMNSSNFETPNAINKLYLNLIKNKEKEKTNAEILQEVEVQYQDYLVIKLALDSFDAWRVKYFANQDSDEL